MKGKISYVIGLLCLVVLLISACSSKTKDMEQPNTAGVASGAVKSEVISTTPDVKKIQFSSDALGKDMRFNIYLPPGYKETKRYPVLYMIHGYTGKEDDWMPGLGLDQAADELLKAGKINPLIIVSPEIDNSYGFNSTLGNYSDYIVHDLIAYVDSHYATIAKKEGRYIGGLSMGGWVALYNAFTHPDLFSKVGGHSPAVWMDDWTNTGDLKSWIYPTDEVRRQRDPLLLAQTEDLSGMSVYLDAGDQDGYKFYDGASALNQELQKRGIPSEYHHAPGKHDGDYWKQYAPDYLIFYSGK